MAPTGKTPFGHFTASKPKTKTAVIQDAFRRFGSSIGLKSKAARRADAIRAKADRFRVLVIGRANAGKTTILQKVCNTSEKPEIFDSRGKKIDTSLVTPAAERGLHNIENELVFQSNPGFIFHDSRGFEAGAIVELQSVKEFIAQRLKGDKFSDQLHVIWYCIPMDDERPFTAAERGFFSECGTGSVPVVAIFTKFDALEDKAFADLEIEGASHEDAVAQMASRAVADFEKLYLPDLYERKYPPSGHVYLRDMDKPETDCRELTETIAAVLDNVNLQRLFVSTQRNNLELCMKYAVTCVLTRAITTMHEITGDMPTTYQSEMMLWYPNFHHGAARTTPWQSGTGMNWYILDSPDMRSRLFPFIGPPPLAQQMARLGVALAIIAEQSFYLWDRVPSDNAAFFISAIGTYESSGKHATVMQAVDEAFKEDGGHLFEQAKGSEDPRNSAFAERLVQIALDNRLPPPEIA